MIRSLQLPFWNVNDKQDVLEICHLIERERSNLLPINIILATSLPRLYCLEAMQQDKRGAIVEEYKTSIFHLTIYYTRLRSTIQNYQNFYRTIPWDCDDLKSSLIESAELQMALLEEVQIDEKPLGYFQEVTPEIHQALFDVITSYSGTFWCQTNWGVMSKRMLQELNHVHSFSSEHHKDLQQWADKVVKLSQMQIDHFQEFNKLIFLLCAPIRRTSEGNVDDHVVRYYKKIYDQWESKRMELQEYNKQATLVAEYVQSLKH